MLRVILRDKSQETLKSIDSPESNPRHIPSVSGGLPRPHQLIITGMEEEDRI